jgi:hypothetical protein
MIADWKNSLPLLAEDHLVRVITVFRYGKPLIDEPLALAHSRALSSVAADWFAKRSRRIERPKSVPIKKLFIYVRELLASEPPACDIKSTISTCVKQMPDWLRYLCNTNFSMSLLELEAAPLSEDVLKLQPKKSDRFEWPFLPRGILEPRSDHVEQLRFVNEMSDEENFSFIRIWQKPEREWTRQERRFVKNMFARDPNYYKSD